jgi:beta-glucosidase/6-phospho-beta-glucosidase/beta-galactosidase
VTPLNEPRITAWYTGKLGWWPPYRRGWSGFFTVLTALCRGIVRVTRAIERTPGVRAVHVDAADLYAADTAELRPEAERRQAVGFLALDLVSGKVNASHALRGWLLRSGVTEADLAWFEEHAVTLDLVGLNLYPLFSSKHVVRRGSGTRIVMRYAKADVLERLCEAYHERYGRPLLVTETATEGSVARRAAWLDASVAAVRSLRGRGVPVVGYTWWPLFALVSWAYRQTTAPAANYLKQMGLYDLVPGEDGELERRATPLVAQFRALATRGAGAVGGLTEPGRAAAGAGE